MSSLARHLEDRTLILLSNREPYEHRSLDGAVDVRQPPGGLVSALDPTMQTTHGVWVAWGSGSADQRTADDAGRLQVPPEHPAYTLHRVFLEDADVNGYYLGFANRSLWPLCHMLVQHFEFRGDHWERYRNVNLKFAEAVASEIERAPRKPVVWIQDYHFGLAAEMIRSIHAPMLLHQFWHIPFPPVDILSFLPTGVHDALLRGMLGNDLIEFQTERYALNFLGCVAELIPDADIDADTLRIFYQGRSIEIASFPISIDVDHYEGLANAQGSAELTQRLRQRYTGDGCQLGLGVDRLDYTKGIPERLRALRMLWQQNPELREKFTFLLVATPSRSELPAYRALEEEMLGLVVEINDRWRTNSVDAHRAHPREHQRRGAGWCFPCGGHLPGVVAAGRNESRGQGIRGLSGGGTGRAGVESIHGCGGRDRRRDPHQPVQHRWLRGGDPARARDGRGGAARADAPHALAAPLAHDLRLAGGHPLSRGGLDRGAGAGAGTGVVTASLLPVPEETVRRLSESPLVVLLDVDGTLAPIAPRPEEAEVPLETRRAVAALTVRSGVQVVLVSGRAAADARRLVSVANVWVIGNHGYEVLGPNGEEVVDPHLAPYRAAVAHAARRLEPQLSPVPGVILEDKGWTLSIHYRLADRAVVPRVRGIVEEVALSLGLKMTDGKEVLEVRPPASVDKGTAVLSLVTRLGLRRDHGAAVFLGDDRTDEDAFRALRAWSAATVTARVGQNGATPPMQTAAEYVLDSPAEVRAFLEWLAAARR